MCYLRVFPETMSSGGDGRGEGCSTKRACCSIATVLAGRGPLRYTGTLPPLLLLRKSTCTPSSKQGAKTKRVHLSHRHHELCRTHAIPYLLFALFSFCFGRLLALQCRYRFPGTVDGWIESHRRIGAHTNGKSGCMYTHRQKTPVFSAGYRCVDSIFAAAILPLDGEAWTVQQ